MSRFGCSLRDAVTVVAEDLGVFRVDVLGEMVGVLGEGVLLRLDGVMKVSDALVLSRVSGVSLGEIVGCGEGLVASPYPGGMSGVLEERLRWMVDLDSYLEDQGFLSV